MIKNVVTQEQLQSQLSGLTFIVLTQAEYDALIIKDDKTLYLIKEG